MNNVISYIQNSNFKLVGVTGSAGSGKTTLASDIALQIGAAVYSADSRFIGDSNFRKTLLRHKAENSILSYIDAANQISWWDFDCIFNELSILKSGKNVDIDSGYNRDSGDVECSHIVGSQKIIYDGAILGHTRIVELLDKIIFVYTLPEVRMNRLLKKDSGRRTFNEILARFLITEYSETQYYKKIFSEYKDKIVVVDEKYNFISMRENWLYEQQYIPLMV